MSSVLVNFIVIDDSRLDCFISEKIIRNTGYSKSLRSFTEAEEALKFIKDTPLISADERKTVILLDIQMPLMSGFDFAEAFERLPDDKRSAYMIFMISSSTNETDRMRIGNYPSIINLYKKPIDKEIIEELVMRVSPG